MASLPEGQSPAAGSSTDTDDTASKKFGALHLDGGQQAQGPLHIFGAQQEEGHSARE